MVKKDPLGRGLSAILKDVEERGTSRIIPVDRIVPAANQPRKELKEEGLVELARSIQEKGVLQPILVRRKGGGYEIVAGERRLRASVMAGLTEIPAIVKDIDDKEALELALIENLQREDLNPIETATVYERFIDEFGYTQEALAKRIGKDRSSISNSLRLLKLPDSIRVLIRDGRLTEGHARALMSLSGEKKQKKFIEDILNKGISVRELERKVRKESIRKESPFSSAEEFLTNALRTKVNITYRKHRGRLIIEFYSREDLERIMELISEKEQ